MRHCKGIKLIICWLACANLILAWNLFSQTEMKPEELFNLSMDELMNVTVTVSSARNVTLFNSPSSVSVIDREMIETYQFQSVAEAIQTVAGIQMVPTYHKRDLPTSRGVLQNQYANKVLVLINGVPSWHSVTGESNIERISIHAVQRIEVLKGPASVLYGSNAYSAAINIILENKQSNYLHMGLGDANSFTTNGYYQYEKGDLSMMFAAGILNEEGPDYFFTGEDSASGHFNAYLNTRNITGTLSWKNHHILYNISSSAQSFLGAGPVTFEYGAGNPHTLNSYLLNYEWSKPLHQNWTLKAGVTYDRNQVEFALDSDNNLRILWDGLRLQGYFQSNLQIKNHLYLDAGGTFTHRECLNSKVYYHQDNINTGDRNLNGKSVFAYSVYAHCNWLANRWNILLGSRLTQNEYFGNDLSLQGAAIFKIGDGHSVKALYGESFRAPSIFEVHVNSPGRLSGNQELMPESSRTLEAAYLCSFHSVFLQLGAFYSDYFDKIHRVPSQEFNLTYANGKHVYAKGLEAELKIVNRKQGGFINMAWITGDNGPSNEGDYNMRYVPEFTLSTGVHRRFGPWRVSFIWHTWSVVNGPQKRIAAPHILDLNLSLKHQIKGMEMTHSLILRNALDKQVEYAHYVDLKPINSVPTLWGFGRRIMITTKMRMIR